VVRWVAHHRCGRRRLQRQPGAGVRWQRVPSAGSWPGGPTGTRAGSRPTLVAEFLRARRVFYW